MKRILIGAMALRWVRMVSTLSTDQVRRTSNIRTMNTRDIFASGLFIRDMCSINSKRRGFTLSTRCGIFRRLRVILFFFAVEKWRIASDKGGSGNTANIGSIKSIPDILSGNGVFALAGEEFFDEYWANYGKLEVRTSDGKIKKLTSFEELLKFKNLPLSLSNKPLERKRRKNV